MWAAPGLQTLLILIASSIFGDEIGIYWIRSHHRYVWESIIKFDISFWLHHLCQSENVFLCISTFKNYDANAVESVSLYEKSKFSVIISPAPVAAFEEFANAILETSRSIKYGFSSSRKSLLLDVQRVSRYEVMLWSCFWRFKAWARRSNAWEARHLNQLSNCNWRYSLTLDRRWTWVRIAEMSNLRKWVVRSLHDQWLDEKGLKC